MTPPVKTYIVVPCFNEARRLCGDVFESFAGEHSDVRFVFVDDGSTDDTLRILQALEARSPEVGIVISQPRNAGKAEAVRVGMNRAFRAGATYAGYWDADLATPLSELPAFVAELDAHPQLQLLLGSRVKLLGRSIERRAIRHYVGRVSATAISIALGLPVYDTQCGAKLFRVSPACEALFATPFQSRWIFDVEILARMLQARREAGASPDPAAIREIPLQVWRDVPGSKVAPSDFLRSFGELWGVWRRYLR
jgi:glycosyltransferase involved in cell wall biosynthesis